MSKPFELTYSFIVFYLLTCTLLTWSIPLFLPNIPAFESDYANYPKDANPPNDPNDPNVFARLTPADGVGELSPSSFLCWP